MNNDGIADVIAVAVIPTRDDGTGYVPHVPEYYAYLGPDLSTYVRFHADDRDSRDDGTYPAWAIASADLDQDGRSELVIGDPRANTLHRVGELSGAVHVFDFSNQDALRGFASGSTGTGGIVPELSGAGSTRPGSMLEISITRGRGAATGMLMVGASRQSELLCTQHAFVTGGPRQWVKANAETAVVLDGIAGTPGGGAARVRFRIPADPALCWTQLFFQALLSDPLAMCGIATTAGLKVTIMPF